MRKSAPLFCALLLSLSARRAWIEISEARGPLRGHLQASLSARRAWIEMPAPGRASLLSRSLSARRAWIEIAPLAHKLRGYSVALRKESVDRNIKQECDSYGYGVALRKESVDRNADCSLPTAAPPTSLSARRAWIEIILPAGHEQAKLGRSPQGERG